MRLEVLVHSFFIAILGSKRLKSLINTACEQDMAMYWSLQGWKQ